MFLLIAHCSLPISESHTVSKKNKKNNILPLFLNIKISSYNEQVMFIASL